MASRAHKKSKITEVKSEELRRERAEDELFTLEYLNNTMSYLLPTTSIPNSCLQIDPAAIESIICRDPRQIGLYFIQSLKQMKQNTREDEFINDYQEYGDFINYDMPREHCEQVRSLEAELREEHQKLIAIKRIRQKFPQAPQHMSLLQLEKWQNKIKQNILDSLIDNAEIVSEQQEGNLERNLLYREMFNIPSGQPLYQSKHEAPGRPPKDRVSIGPGRPPKKAMHDVKDGRAKIQKSKKVGKPKKADSKTDLQQEYVPKVKKAGKLDDLALVSSQRRAEGLASDSMQQVMVRRSNQLEQEKELRPQKELRKDENHNSLEGREQIQGLSLGALSVKTKRKYKKIKKQKGSDGQPSKQLKVKHGKQKKTKNHEVKQISVSLKQKIEARMIVEREQHQETKIRQDDRPPSEKQQVRQVSIGIQVESLDSKPPPSQLQQTLPSLLDYNRQPHQSPLQGQPLLTDQPIVDNHRPKQEMNGAVKIRERVEREGQRISEEGIRENSAIVSGHMMPEINPDPVNIQGPSSSNVNEEPDISELLKLD